jgi:hypothetical protein
MEGWVTHVGHCRNGILKNDYVNDVNDISVSKY